MSPVSTDFNVRLWDAAVADEEPETKDGLSQHVENSVRQNLRVDRRLAGTIGESPYTCENVSAWHHDCEVVN